jgi:4-amino-4-deoxy-L-arabinose transferase-like glycosyltransferase
MGAVARQRMVGTYLKETDFYHLYAPDADRILTGHAPIRTFNTGPLYPLLLALAHPLTGDHFASGKGLALVAAAVTAASAFALFRGLFGARAALLALAVVVTSADFARFSVQATTDLPFLALAVAAMLAITRAPGRGALGWGLAGALTGLACLLRYNGLFLAPTALLAAALGEPTARARWRAAGLYGAALGLVVAPWLVVSYRVHGTPLFHRTYLIMAIQAYGLPRDLDGVREADARFASALDVMRHAPWVFTIQYLRNVGSTVFNTLGAPLAILPVGLLGVVGAARIVREPSGAPARPLLGSAVLFLLLVSLAHWESRYVLYVGVVLAGLAAHAAVTLAARAARAAPGAVGRAGVALGLLALALLGPALVRTPRRVAELVAQEPREVLPAAAAVRRLAPPGTPVMGRKPHVAYLAGAEWAYLPNVSSLDALRASACRAAARYLVYDEPARKLRPGLAALGGPDPGAPWLRRVHGEPGGPLIVYEVQVDAGCPEAPAARSVPR